MRSCKTTLKAIFIIVFILTNFLSFSPAVTTTGGDILAQVVAGIGSNETTLEITNQQNITDDLIIPATLTLKFTQGGTLNISNTKTVTINGHVEAGLSQIFEGDGTVEFGAGSVKEVYPEWWGAMGAGDHAPAWNEAIAAASDGSTINACGRTYKLSSTVNINKSLLISAEGTTLDVDWPLELDGAHVFDITSSNVTIDGGMFDGTNTTDTFIECQVIDASTVGVPYENIVIKNVRIANFNYAGFGGIRIWGAKNARVEDNCLDSLPETSILFRVVSDSYISKNRIIDSGHAAINLYFDCYRIHVDKNTVHADTDGTTCVAINSHSVLAGNPNEDIWFTENYVTGYYGYGSAMRMLSTHRGFIQNNIFRNIKEGTDPENPTDLHSIIYIGNRTEAEVYGRPSSHVLISNNYICQEANDEEDIDAIRIQDGNYETERTNNITIRDNYILITGTHWARGIRLFNAPDASGMHDIRIIDNYFSMEGGTPTTAAILLISPSTGYIKYVNIHGNTFISQDSEERSGVGFVDTGEVIISDLRQNIFRDLGAGIPSSDGTDVTIVKNITDNLFFGCTININAIFDLQASDTWNPGSIAVGAMESKGISVNGAVLGDFAIASFSLDVANLVLSAQVVQADIVRCVLANNTAEAVDLGEGTICVKVIKQ